MIGLPVVVATAIPVATGVPKDVVVLKPVTEMEALPVGVSSPKDEVKPAPDSPLLVVKIKSPLPQDAAFHPNGIDVPTPLFHPVKNSLSTIVGLGIVPNTDVTALPDVAYSLA